jgi:Tol biopolymer transport system component
MNDASLGWVFSPRYSPDGTKIAFAWSRQKDYGLWMMNTRDSSQKLVYGSSVPVPIGWSADGAWVYALEGKRAAYRGTATYLGETLTEAKVLKISESGVATTLFALPFGEVGGVAVTPDGRRFICAVYSSRSDVWIVENFDASEDAGRAPHVG